jgi:uncharacterized protein YukE
MTFTVEARAVRRYAGQMGDAAEDVRAGRDYIVTHTTMPMHEEGLLNRLQPAHERLATEITARLTHLMDIFDQSKAALASAADYYQHTDDAAAARTDATLPTVSRQDEEMYTSPGED